MHFEKVLAQQIPGLCPPLLCIIDYHGYRVIALSKLPIDKSTLMYGSHDGGTTVQKGHPELASRMESLFHSLNLKKHHIGSSGVELAGPGDAEGHVGFDDRFYVLDFARLMPPELDMPALRQDPRLVFSRLLRPEFVMRYPIPLCADAGTSWDAADPTEAKTNVEEVKEATRMLHTKVIPLFAQELLEDEADLPQPEASVESVLAQYFRVGSSRFHSAGLNVRAIGRVRAVLRTTSESPTATRLCRIMLSIAIARVLKNIANEEMRRVHQQLFVPSHHPFLDIVVQHANLLLNHDSVEFASFWHVDVKEVAQIQFPELLSASEQDFGTNLWSKLCPVLTSLLLFQLLGVRISSDLEQEILATLDMPAGETRDIHVLPSDIVGLNLKVKTLTSTNTWHSSALWLQSQDTALSSASRLRLLSVLWRQLNERVQQAPASPIAAFQCAMVSTVLASLLTERHPSLPLRDLFMVHQEPLLSHAIQNLQTVCLLLSGRSQYGIGAADRQAISQAFVDLLGLCRDCFSKFDETSLAQECDTVIYQHQNSRSYAPPEEPLNSQMSEQSSANNLLYWLPPFQLALQVIRQLLLS